MTVAPDQRYTRYHPCPICEGFASDKQGEGRRCYGYLSRDGKYAYCTREERATGLEIHKGAGYPHILHGPCKCGNTHGQARSTVRLDAPRSNGKKPDPDITAEYDFIYRGEQNRVSFKVKRIEYKDGSKRIWQEHPENGKWVKGLGEVEPVLYHLPELLKASPGSTVYEVEGEKKVDLLRSWGLLATCNPMGAGKWYGDKYSHFLKGLHVVILPDNDKAGWDHAEQVHKSLVGVAESARMVSLPGLKEKGDIVDWAASGGTREQLEKLTAPPKRKFTYASDIEEQPIEWVWDHRIARGCFTLGVGDAGMGKGLTLMKVIAAITRGNGLPGDNHREPAGVILMSPEDSASRTIVPRLKAADADLTRVLLLSEVEEIGSDGQPYCRPISFPEDVSILREAIETCSAVLVVIDPVLSILSAKVDAHKNHAVRQALMQLMSTAEKHNCAVLGVMHTVKTLNPNALFRSSSSSAFIEMARTALFFVNDPDGEQGQSGVIVNHKNNLAKHADSIRYSISQNEKGIGYITWAGVSPYTRDELLNQSSPTDNPKSEQETELIKVLKEHKVAMTPAQIHEKMQTAQSLNALEVMLKRKLEQGVLMRPARGIYTYYGNPLYPAKNTETDVSNVSSVSDVSDVSDVSSSNDDETYITEPDVSFGNPSETASHAPSDETYKTYITFDENPLPTNVTSGVNGRGMRAEAVDETDQSYPRSMMRWMESPPLRACLVCKSHNWLPYWNHIGKRAWGCGTCHAEIAESQGTVYHEEVG